MTLTDDLPFTVGQEVEAKFNESGYRGAWFRCRIREMSAAEPKLLLQYVDFLDEEDSWARVCMADPAIKSIEPWLKQKKPSIWMVRPVPPIVHESNVVEYQKDVCMGRKCSSHVYIYNDMYMVGDMVDWLKDDCFWAAQIVGINTETNEAKIKFPLPPVGEGDGKTHNVPFKELRPSFSWNPKHQWRQLGSKKKEARTSVKKCNSNRLHIQQVYLSGDSVNPSAVSDHRCEPISSGKMSSVCKSEPDDSAVNFRGTSREHTLNIIDSHELVVTSEDVYDRVKLRKHNIVDGAKPPIKQEASHEAKLEKGRRRKVWFTSSFACDSDLWEQSSPTGEPESILEHLRNGIAVSDSINDLVATANEGLPHEEFVIHDTALGNGVSARRGTPINADDGKGGPVVPELVGAEITHPSESPGSCFTTENEDGLSDQTAKVDGDGRSDVRPRTQLIVSGIVVENSSLRDSIAGCADHRSAVRAEVCFPAHDGSTAPREAFTDNVYDFDNVVAEDIMNGSGLEVHLLVSAGTSTALMNPPSPDNTTTYSEKVTEKPYDFESGVTTVYQTASDLVPEGTQVPLENTTRDENHVESKLCVPGGNLNEVQSSGSPADVVTKNAFASRRGRGKLLSHRSCVETIKAGRSRKRRREMNQVDIRRKRRYPIDTNQGVELPVCLADGSAEEPLSSSVPPTPTNNEKKSSVFESIVKPELRTCEEENRIHVVDDSILEPLWVLALPRIRDGKVSGVIHSTPSTTPSDMEQKSSGNSADFNRVLVTVPSDTNQQCPDNEPDFHGVHVTAPSDTVQQCAPDAIEGRDLEDDLDVLERLIARVHVLGAYLQRDKVQKRKKIVWKISDGSVFISGEGEGVVFDEEANDFDVNPHSGDNSELNYIPNWYLQSVLASALEKDPDREVDALPCSDPEYMQEMLPCVSADATNTLQKDGNTNLLKVSSDSFVWGRKSQSRRTTTKRGTKRMKCVSSLGTCNSQKLRQPEPTNQLMLLGSGIVTSKVNGWLKRKQVDDKVLGKDSKKIRAGVSTALVEAVGNSPVGVELPLMRGSVKFSKGKPVRLRRSQTSQKPTSEGKCTDSVIGRMEQLVESVGFHQEQQLKDPLCGHIEQILVEKSLLNGFHLSSGSNLGLSSLSNLDSEVLDNEYEENKIKLQPNGHWCIKVFTVDGKVEWIGNHATKEKALSAYDFVNPPFSPNEKGVSPPSHTSSSCLREQADEKVLKGSTLANSNKGNASKSSSTAVEPIVGSTVSIAKEVNETAGGVSRLNETFGAGEQEGEGQDAGVPEIILKSAETYEQESLVISTKKITSVGLGEEISSLSKRQGDIQEKTNIAHNLSGRPLDSSRREQVVNAAKDIQYGGIVQDKPSVKVGVVESQPAAPAGSVHDGWVHDTVKCRFGKNVLDRLCLNNFATTEEIEVARQVKMALWRGLCCSSQSCGLGLDLFKRIQLLLQPRMHFEMLADGDSYKILLSTGKPGEEIYLGHYRTETEFGTARRTISRCKKGLQKSLVMFDASHNSQVTSDVLQTTVPLADTSLVISPGKERSSSFVEGTEQLTGPTSASQVTGEPGLQGLIISRELGQSSTRTKISPEFSKAAGHSTLDPTAEQIPCRHAPVRSGAAAEPQNVIVLDDDDDNEVHVAPVSSLPTSAKDFSGVIHVGNNASAQRENNVQSHRYSRAYGLLNDVVSVYPLQIQEQRCHLTGSSSVGGQIGARQADSNYFQTVNTDIDPVQRVGQASGTSDAQLHGGTLPQLVRQEGLDSQLIVAASFLSGNVVCQQQQLVNQHDGTVRVNFVDSFGRRVEIPTRSSQALQGPVRVSTSYVPVNRPREMGNSTSLPTACNTSAAATPRFTSKNIVYSCCSNIVASEQDFILFKALRCANCNRTVHTNCAIASNQLVLWSLSVRTSVQEKVIYVCACGKLWLVLPIIVSRMGEFIMQIRRQQLDRLNRDAHPVTVLELDWGQELNVIMGTLHKIVSKARIDSTLKTIKYMVEYMHGSIRKDANNVNFSEWLKFMDHALKLLMSTIYEGPVILTRRQAAVDSPLSYLALEAKSV